MGAKNIKKSQQVFTFFDLVVITLALLIGNIIHEIEMVAVVKTFIVLTIAVIIFLLDKADFRKMWKITKIGRINKYLFFGYILIAQFILSIIIQF